MIQKERIVLAPCAFNRSSVEELKPIRRRFRIRKTTRAVCLLIVFIVSLIVVLGCSKNPVSDRKEVFAISVVVDGNGSVKSPSRLTQLQSGSGISITAVPDSGSSFICWNGDIKATANPLTFIVTKSCSLQCMFSKNPSGMKKIESSDKTFYMGSSNASSALAERPSHRVTFTYDYFIDKYETTQGEYATLMGSNPSTGNTNLGSLDTGGNFPVYYVRWYDAVLFCNAKSKRDGYDTVYSFTAKCDPRATCPYVLERCAIHYDRLGYRLPTEAEWEYACGAGATTDFFWGNGAAAADSFAWYFDNSQGRTHQVGQKRPNNFGLHDMTGNVAEWVNDWRGNYPDSICVNPLGPRNLPLEVFEASWERPVRGGCFTLGSSYLRSNIRSGPYPIAASAVNKYTGFRTVIGMFFPDTEAHTARTTADSFNVALECYKSNLISFLGTSRIKIAFVTSRSNGNRQLCYSDFTNPNAGIRRVRDSISIHCPDISPNGAYIAYGSKAAGFTGSSAAAIRLLNTTDQSYAQTAFFPSMFLPHWFVDPASFDTFVVYTDGASMNNLSAWNNEKTYRRKFSGGSLSDASEIVCGKGSFHGGMSRDGQFLATGYPRALVYDTKADRIIQYFLPPYNGRCDTGQVCNVSMTPGIDRPDEIIFLDFGYSLPSTIIGKPYPFHSIIFIANSNSKASHNIQKMIEVPAGYASWDNVRWSNHPDFAVAIGQSSGSDIVSSLFLINVKNSRFLKVATGEGLSEPCVWIDPAEISELPDPHNDFAKYNVPSNSIAQYMLDIELKFFWSHRQSVECGFVGSSQVMMSIVPSLFTHVKTLQLGTNGMEFTTGQLIIKNYLCNLSPRLKVVGMSCDPGWIPMDYTLADPHDLGFANSRGLQFDKKNDFWEHGVPSAIEAKTRSFNATSWPELDSSGAQNNVPLGQGWGAPELDGGDYAITDAAVQRYLELLKNLTDSLAVKGVHFLLVKFPENPEYRTKGFVSRYGPSYTTYYQLVACFRRQEQGNRYFHFYDANMNGNHDYTSAEALDCNHLNCLGRQKLSVRLDSVITTFLH